MSARSEGDETPLWLGARSGGINAPLPADFDYAAVAGLSNEVRERLRERLPATVAQASRVPGVTPAALSLLRVHSRRHAEAVNTADQAQRATASGSSAAVGHS